jgi:hypothetical protein
MREYTRLARACVRSHNAVFHWFGILTLTILGSILSP